MPHFGRPKDPSASLSHAHAWHHRQPHELVARHLPDSEILFEDAGDCSFSLFPESPQQQQQQQQHSAMAQMAAPMDFEARGRPRSNSPQNQTSNLTSALREAEANRDTSATPSQLTPNGLDFQRPGMGERHPSISMLGSSLYGSGARPISMKDRARRESNQMGSFAGGMSWGAVSVGSWIRDE